MIDVDASNCVVDSVGSSWWCLAHQVERRLCKLEPIGCDSVDLRHLVVDWKPWQSSLQSLEVRYALPYELRAVLDSAAAHRAVPDTQASGLASPGSLAGSCAHYRPAVEARSHRVWLT